jgi:metal-responsive CopG/Arc/MetJ family transcriptional regulator
MAKLMNLSIPLPKSALDEIARRARSQYLSRSAVARQMLLRELARRENEERAAKGDA